MMKISQARTATLALLLAIGASAFGHETAPFGETGNAKRPSRTVHVVMREAGTKMLFEPNMIEVRKGEQIRFVVDNEGLFNHEFVLGTEQGIAAHALEMRKNPDMEHDDAHSLTLGPYASGELTWRFTKLGRFVFACLIPGHMERGMKGTIVVK